jgi:hypothetical protein
MKSYDTLFTVVIITSIIGFGTVLGKFVTEYKYRKIAIQYGCARYNPVTSNFEWIDRKP